MVKHSSCGQRFRVLFASDANDRGRDGTYDGRMIRDWIRMIAPSTPYKATSTRKAASTAARNRDKQLRLLLRVD